MAITADFHLHSSFSGDSEAPMDDMVAKGICLGLTHMCFTEHNDFDYPETPDTPAGIFEVNTDSYLYDLLRSREKYGDFINLLFGIELGLQPQLGLRNKGYIESYDFDFVIGSTHVCHGKDPYYPSFFEGRTEEEAYREYLQTNIDNIKAFQGFDVYGHLDYVVRYGPNLDREYSYEKYQDLFDTMLRLVIENGKGIELNTGGFKKGMREFHPCTKALKRYRELGGEILTVGSDSHETIHIADGFKKAEEVLKECGFRYYTIFEKRTPRFIKL